MGGLASVDDHESMTCVGPSSVIEKTGGVGACTSGGGCVGFFARAANSSGGFSGTTAGAVVSPHAITTTRIDTVKTFASDCRSIDIRRLHGDCHRGDG